MTFITQTTDRKLGEIKGSEIAKILEDPELLNKLGLHMLSSVAEFVAQHTNRG
ncbi:MAG: hypothetical protein ACTHKV_14420 [Flavipsychrobacter sp.]